MKQFTVTFKLERDRHYLPTLRFKNAWFVRIKGGRAFYLYETTLGEWTTGLQEERRYPNKIEALTEGFIAYWHRFDELRNYNQCRAKEQVWKIKVR